ncbi:hypothetical protein NE237_030426 [Protea cynaroides]|uniref:Uncharacterized protein n=1 Tax=Protea cynaroides TaxID=273540 RepID=A0A9Q0GU27_9MAGN|nr:hypothetical protein NE237_030426 [Protea cynaroides]
MALNATQLRSVMKLIMGSQTFALRHFGVASIISCVARGKNLTYIEVVIHVPKNLFKSYSLAVVEVVNREFNCPLEDMHWLEDEDDHIIEHSHVTFLPIGSIFLVLESDL